MRLFWPFYGPLINEGNSNRLNQVSVFPRLSARLSATGRHPTTDFVTRVVDTVLTRKPDGGAPHRYVRPEAPAPNTWAADHLGLRREGLCPARDQRGRQVVRARLPDRRPPAPDHRRRLSGLVGPGRTPSRQGSEKRRRPGPRPHGSATCRSRGADHAGSLGTVRARASARQGSSVTGG